MEAYNLQCPKWDTFRVEIPAHKVENKTEIGKRAKLTDYDNPNIIYAGGEGEEPLVKMVTWREDRGIKLKFQKVYRRVGQSEEERYCIYVSAKMLGSDYFEGLNRNNIRKVYDYIQSFNALIFSFEDFLEGKVYDVDMCYDVNATPVIWNDLCKKVAGQVKFEYQRYLPKQKWENNTKNVGTQLSERNGGTVQKPFIKLYHKGLELTNKSYEFNNNFIQKNNLPIGRIEYNFRGKKWFEYYDYVVETVRDLLGLGLDAMKRMILGSIYRFYIEQRIIERDMSKLGPQDFYINYLVKSLIEDSGKSVDWFLKCVEDYKRTDVADSQVYRLTSYIKKSLSDDSFKDKLEHNNAVEGLYREIIENPN